MKRFPAVWIVPAVFLADRLFKNFILNQAEEGGGFRVWPGVFHLTRVNNTGAAFGVLKGTGVLLSVLAAVFAVFILIQLVRGRASWAWALVAGGALGNLYDRLRYGYVIDFLDFRIWPVFNLADLSICLGVFFILLSHFKRKPE